MAVIEWEGKVRITIGKFSRAGRLDLFQLWSDSEWYERKENASKVDGVRSVMQTDAMVAVIATRKIEVCDDDGKWSIVKKRVKVEHEGETFTLSFPPDYNAINDLPFDLGDLWVEAAVENNGGVIDNISFFSSLTMKSGKTDNEPKSEKQP